MRRQTLALAGALAAATSALALAGCAHNDVLIFGTDTKIALDVETAATQGASPSITVGYKRKEAVWMPLVVNGRGSAYAGCQAKGLLFVGCKPRTTTTTVHSPPPGGTTTTVSPALPDDGMKYQSTVTNYDKDGRVTSIQKDAYSVFASIGANIKGGATAEPGTDGKPKAGATAGVGVAQFFATGNAAINLTRNPALVTALKVEGGEGAQAQANAVAAVAQADPASYGLGVNAALTQQQRLDAIINAVSANGQVDKTKLAALVEKANTAKPGSVPTALKDVTAADQIRDMLRFNQVAVGSLFAAL